MASVKDQSAAAVANAVKLSRVLKKQKAAVLLEGKSDLRLYSHFLDTTRCEVYVAHGRNNVLGALAILERDRLQGVIAIVDVDSDYIFSRSVAAENVCVTDVRDLEGMLFDSPSLDKVFRENELKLQDDFRNKLLKAAMPLGYLRAVCLEKNWTIDFKQIVVGSFFDPLKIETDQEKMYVAILQARENQGFGRTPQEMRAEVQQISSDDHSPGMVTRGHDLSQLLTKVMNARMQIQHTTQTVESQLRLAFESDHFRTTQLFRSLCVWQKKNAPFVIVRFICP